MSGRRGAVRGKAQRAICPECGRNTAAMWNADMTWTRQTATYFLHPHNIEPGRRCRGWMVGKEALVPTHPTAQDHANGSQA